MLRPTGQRYPNHAANDSRVTCWWQHNSTIIDKRVISIKSGRTTDSGWEILEEEGKQELSQNGALRYTRRCRSFLRPITIYAGWDFTVFQVAFSFQLSCISETGKCKSLTSDTELLQSVRITGITHEITRTVRGPIPAFGRFPLETGTVGTTSMPRRRLVFFSKWIIQSCYLLLFFSSQLYFDSSVELEYLLCLKFVMRLLYRCLSVPPVSPN